MQSVIMPIGMNINENGGKKTQNKIHYSWQLTERKEIIKTLNDSQMNNAVR